MIDVHYASLTSQGVQHRVLYLDGHPSRYQPHPTGLNFGEQTGTGVFPLVKAVPLNRSMPDTDDKNVLQFVTQCTTQRKKGHKAP